MNLCDSNAGIQLTTLKQTERVKVCPQSHLSIKTSKSTGSAVVVSGNSRTSSSVCLREQMFHLGLGSSGSVSQQRSMHSWKSSPAFWWQTPQKLALSGSKPGWLAPAEPAGPRVLRKYQSGPGGTVDGTYLQSESDCHPHHQLSG